MTELTHSIKPINKPFFPYPGQTTKSDDVVIAWSEEKDFDEQGNPLRKTGCTLTDILEAVRERIRVILTAEENQATRVCLEEATEYIGDAILAVRDSCRGNFNETDEASNEPATNTSTDDKPRGKRGRHSKAR